MSVRFHSAESVRLQQQQARRDAGVKRRRIALQEPLTRLITMDSARETVTQAVELDVLIGRDDVPTLYEPIYERLASDTLPRVVPTNLITEADCVFLETFEGGEVRFGTLSPGQRGNVEIRKFTTGFAYTEENEMFDEDWAVQRFYTSMGRAYNALLNHVHLGAILSFTYTGANQTAADTTGATVLDRTRNTIINGYRASATAKRPGTILLAATADRFQIEDTLARRWDNVGNQLPAADMITDVILYDGWTGKVGRKTYSYPGVTAKKAYLIQPKQRFVEVVKTRDGQDLVFDIGNPDVSRGISDQIVGKTWRTIYADVGAAVQELTLP